MGALRRQFEQRNAWPHGLPLINEAMSRLASLDSEPQSFNSGAVLSIRDYAEAFSHINEMVSRAGLAFYFAATTKEPELPEWYSALEQLIESETVFTAESDYPTAEPTARQRAAVLTREVYDAFGTATPEPYFDSTLDLGVDIYFDHGQNQMHLHVPPLGSNDDYCFRRVNGERSVERNPTFERVLEILGEVVTGDGVQAE